MGYDDWLTLDMDAEAHAEEEALIEKWGENYREVLDDIEMLKAEEIFNARMANRDFGLTSNL